MRKQIWQRRVFPMCDGTALSQKC